MSLIKKIDVPKYFAARRAMRLGSVQGLSRPGGRATDAAGAVANEAKFTKDFSLEHSASSALVPPKE
jgi:hypothetical protein